MIIHLSLQSPSPSQGELDVEKWVENTATVARPIRIRRVPRFLAITAGALMARAWARVHWEEQARRERIE